jgi:hypothetical protein
VSDHHGPPGRRAGGYCLHEAAFHRETAGVFPARFLRKTGREIGRRTPIRARQGDLPAIDGGLAMKKRHSDLRPMIGKTARKRVGVIMGGSSGEREVSLQLRLRGGERPRSARPRGRTRHARRVLRTRPRGDPPERPHRRGLPRAPRPPRRGRLRARLLELCRIPYTGSNVLASALAMDKLKAKEMFRLHNVPTPPYYTVAGTDDLADLEGRTAPSASR